MRLPKQSSVRFLILCLVLWGTMAGAAEPVVQRRIACEMPGAPSELSDWTILFYCNADFQGLNVSDLFAQRMQSRDNVTVLMLEDPYVGEATLWLEGGDAEAPMLRALEAWGEVDMGGAETLARLLAFAQTWYPSKQTMAMLYSHGNGWRGVCYDDHPSTDVRVETTWLTPDEISAALRSVGGIDVLLLTSPCNTGTLEFGYELRQCTSLFVASEAGSSLYVWEKSLPLILDSLTTRPELPIETLGMQLSIWVQGAYDRAFWTDQLPEDKHSLIPTAVLSSVLGAAFGDDLAESLDVFSQALIAALPEYGEQINQARRASQDFAYRAYVDACEFADQVSTIMGMKDVSDRFREALSHAIIQSVTDNDSHPSAHGLSLYFPINPSGALSEREYDEQYGFGYYREDYIQASLDLVDETRWDEFLVEFYKTVLD